MRKESELGPLLAIAIGAAVAIATARAGLGGWHFEFSTGSDAVARAQAAVEQAEGAPPVRETSCRVRIHLDAQPSDWAVVGSYDLTARLVPEGLLVQLENGSALAAERDAQVRGIVVGLAQGSDGDGWSVTHSAEPMPLGALERGVRRPVAPDRRVIPGVGPAELADGWLVVEHVLDAPDETGGTAWTYLHADRAALHPLLDPGCAARL